jgi:hypothetical protein
MQYVPRRSGNQRNMLLNVCFPSEELKSSLHNVDKGVEIKIGMAMMRGENALV